MTTNAKEKLIYIKWLPTYRCNCRCIHCDALREASDECSLELIEERILGSECFEGGMLSLAGGEPFLRKGVGAMLSRVYNSHKLGALDVTTNGTCVEEIDEFCDLIGDSRNISISVSIDGTPEIHNHIRNNPIAFQSAVNSVNLLRERGIDVYINYVMQRENIDNMEEFRHLINKLCGEVIINWIPLLPEAAGENLMFPYTQTQVEKILPYILERGDLLFKNYIMREGGIVLKHCHAGSKSILISPSGKVYPCLTGVVYKKWGREDAAFCIGDLNEQLLDQVFNICQAEDAMYRKNIADCKCRNYCELGVEMMCYGTDLEQFITANKNDVVNCYRYILGREPESDKSTKWFLDNCDSLRNLRRMFLQSEEFRNMYCKM